MKLPQCTIYTRNAGLEISSFERRAEGKPCEGRISLRFFTLGSGTQQVRFVAHPGEGFELYRLIKKVYLEGNRETLTHKFEGSDGEVTSTLIIEKFEKNNRTGFAFKIQRGGESINIPTSASDFLYAAEFLRHLSLSEAWVEKAPKEGRFKVEQSDVRN